MNFTIEFSFLFGKVFFTLLNCFIFCLFIFRCSTFFVVVYYWVRFVYRLFVTYSPPFVGFFIVAVADWMLLLLIFYLLFSYLVIIYCRVQVL